MYRKVREAWGRPMPRDGGPAWDSRPRCPVVGRSGEQCGYAVGWYRESGAPAETCWAHRSRRAALRAAAERAAEAVPCPDAAGPLEALLLEGWLPTASPMQRAISRIADGAPIGALKDDAIVITALGGADAIAALPVGARPAELVIVAGVRCGKSLLAAALGVRSALDCDLAGLADGETARVSIISLRRDLARVVHEHIIARSRAVPRLAGRVEALTQESIMVRHDSGRHVEIAVVAGHAAGSSVVARWSAGVILDEAPRMHAADEAAVSYDDIRAATLGRLLPGAQLVAIGSPWAPWGPIYDIVQTRWGRPSPQCVVIRATGPAMWPAHWTPAECAALRAADEQAYAVDVECQWRDTAAGMYREADLIACTRSQPRECDPEDDHHYVAAMDPATRGDAWTLIIATTRRDAVRCVAVAREWVPGREPLSPRRVLGEIASVCRRYGLSGIATDQWSCDALSDLGVEHGIHLSQSIIGGPMRVDAYDRIAVLLRERRLELPDVPHLRTDLLRARRRTTTTGVTVELPHTSDGRHCDYAAALALALTLPCPPPPPTWAQQTPAARLASAEAAAETEALRRAEERRLGAEHWPGYADPRRPP